jgi:hypothetical protein
LEGSYVVRSLEATIKLEYDDARTAVAVAAAISPENLTAPTGLFVKTTREGCCIITMIRGGAKLSTFLSTIDDLLASAAAAEKILRTIT